MKVSWSAMGFLQQLGNYSYSYSYNYGGSDIDELVRALDTLIPIYTVMLLFSLALGILIYVFNSIALMTIAKRRGLSSPWIAWIPFCSGYALGKISDDINAKIGKRSSHRKVLLALTIISEGCIYLSLGILLQPFVSMLSYLTRYGTMPAFYDAEALVMQMLLACGLAFIGSILAIIYIIFYYIALYNVFKTYSQGNAVLFLVLSILISICSTIFLFVIRNHEPFYPMPPMGYYPPNGYNPYQTYTPNQQYPPQNQQYQQYQQPPQGGYQNYPPGQGGFQTYQPAPPTQSNENDNQQNTPQ